MLELLIQMINTSHVFKKRETMFAQNITTGLKSESLSEREFQ